MVFLNWFHKSFIKLAIFLVCCFFKISCSISQEGQEMRNCSVYQKIYDNADLCLKEARSLIEVKNFEKANLLLIDGINLIDTNYSVANVIDDTSSKLLLAEVEEDRGNLKTSTNLRAGILKARLELLSQKIESEKCQ